MELLSKFVPPTDNGLDTRTIDATLNKLAETRPHYLGCHPSDRIPVPRRFPASAVINLDNSREDGSHWVAYYAPSPGILWYFDSFGAPATAPLKRFLQRFQWRTQNHCIAQSLTSDVCGEYCIMFIYCCSIGMSYSQFMSLLNEHVERDRFVHNCVRSLIKIKPSVTSFDTVTDGWSTDFLPHGWL